MDAVPQGQLAPDAGPRCGRPAADTTVDAVDPLPKVRGGNRKATGFTGTNGGARYIFLDGVCACEICGTRLRGSLIAALF